jgi:hypothetical protein
MASTSIRFTSHCTKYVKQSWGLSTCSFISSPMVQLRRQLRHHVHRCSSSWLGHYQSCSDMPHKSHSVHATSPCLARTLCRWLEPRQVLASLPPFAEDREGQGQTFGDRHKRTTLSVPLVPKILTPLPPRSYLTGAQAISVILPA